MKFALILFVSLTCFGCSDMVIIVTTGPSPIGPIGSTLSPAPPAPNHPGPGSRTQSEGLDTSQ